MEEIGDEAFRDCRALTNIVVGSGLKKVGWRAFDTYCDATDIHVRDMAAWCGIVFVGETPKYNALYLNGKQVENLAIPDGVTYVGDAFARYERLSNVTFPASLIDLSNTAFSV